MTDAAHRSTGEFSLFTLGTTLLRRRARIARWAVGGAFIAGALALLMPVKYASSASFVPQGTDAGRSGLASLAGQLGVALPTANQAQSPDFYLRLIRSRVLLERIARDTFVVAEMGGKRLPFAELFEVEGASPQVREEESVALLNKIVRPSVVKLTGIIEVVAVTPWPSVSKAIVTELIRGVDDFNQGTRRAQAAAERQFVEGRLALANSDLRAAEDRLERFLASNRQFGGSQELTFQRERLQRDVSVKQQVYMTLTQAYEDVRIREVRDTPVISLLESPSTPTEPQPRHRVTIVVAGLLLGAFAALALSLVSEGMAARRRQGDVGAEEFGGALDDMRRAISRRLRPARATTPGAR
jgi:uncharacterized protein involved in exopolysaccharide biosynthesis